jgi:hypothetical protein
LAFQKFPLHPSERIVRIESKTAVQRDHKCFGEPPKMLQKIRPILGEIFNLECEP